MSIDSKQLRELVIIPTLKYLDPLIPFSNAAVKLLEMTAAHESHMGTYLAQIGGPALGIYQMEPETEVDIEVNYLQYREYLDEKVVQTGSDLSTDLAYATAMARVHYYRDKEALPDSDDLIGLANYCKRVWNTEEGKATARQYYAAFKKYVE